MCEIFSEENDKMQEMRLKDTSVILGSNEKKKEKKKQKTIVFRGFRANVIFRNKN